MMEEMLRLSALCIAVSLLITVIGQGNRTMGMLAALTAGLVLFGWLLPQLSTVLSTLQQILDTAGIGTDLLAPVVKVLGIALCARLCGALCLDMGNRWAANGIEMFGVLSALICVLPLLERVLHLIGSI